MSPRRPFARASALAFGFALGLTGGVSVADLPKVEPVKPMFNGNDTKLVNVTRTQSVFHDDEDLVFYALRAKGGACGKFSVEIDGVETLFSTEVNFPYTLTIGHNDKLYPKKDGTHTITLRGKSLNCTGEASTTFVTKHAPETKGQGKITGLRINNYPANGLGKLLIEGSGQCRLKVMVVAGATWSVASANAPVFSREYDAPVQLPFIVPALKPVPAGDYVAWVVVMDPNDKGEPDPAALAKYPGYKGCLGSDPLVNHRGVELPFHTNVGTLYESRELSYEVVKGSVTDFRVSGFANASSKGQIEVKGTGKCRIRADIMDMSKPNPAASPVFSKFFNPFVTVPVTLDNLGPLPDGKYRAALAGYDKDLCPLQAPGASNGFVYRDFKVGTGVASNSSSNNSSGGGAPGGAPAAGGGSSQPPPATGKIASMLVPGGSFAEDEAQKIQVNGQGGCAADLFISNKSYGGSFEKTFDVQPVKLDGGATLYNGVHFDTLAEGSYKATATGKAGCTGNAAIDFKVTAKTSTKKVMGKPTLSFDQQPKSGGVFTVSKDSNIWFKVTVPQSIKDEPYASCCDVQYEYVGQYGGWELPPNSPFGDPSFGSAVTQAAAVVPKSVSGFKEGTSWRMRVRAYKFKTEFEWSDWVPFKVDMH